MKAIILQCNPSTKFHSGKIRVDTTNMLEDSSEILHSDTLFSAIVNLAAKVMPDEVENVIDWFRNDLIKISSIFYCLEKNGEYLYFLPKPIHFNIESAGYDRKSVKRIDFVSKGILEANTAVKDWFDENICTVIQDQFLCLNTELLALGVSGSVKKSIKIYDIVTTPKVHVHKNIEDKRDRYYTQTNIHLADNEGFANINLYFLIEEKIKNEDKIKWQTLLSLLPHEGIGGDRSAGCGIFEGIEEMPFELQSQQNKIISLSLSIPIDASEFEAFEYFQFTYRGGRQTHNDGILKRVRMINEGAILKNATVNGSLADISDKGNSKYYRNGKCFVLKY